MSSAVLLDPEATFKLNEVSLRERIESCPGGAALYKQTERLRTRPGNAPAWKIACSYLSFFQAIGAPQDLTMQFQQLIDELQGLPSAEVIPGIWSLTAPLVQTFLVPPDRAEAVLNSEIEIASRPVDRCLNERNYPGAAAAWTAQPLIKAFVTPLALEWLTRSRNPNEALVTRACGLLDAQACMLGKVDAELLASAGPDYPRLMDLVGQSGKVKPGRAYLHWLMHRVGAETHAQLLDIAAEGWSAEGGEVDLGTIKRWSSGRVFPTEAKLRVLIGALRRGLMAQGHSAGVADSAHSNAFWAARRLSRLAIMLRGLAGPPALVFMDDARHNLMDLLGAKDTEAWLRDRAQHWARHWSQSQSIGLG